VSTLGNTCVPPTVNCLQFLVTGSTLTVVGLFQLPAHSLAYVDKKKEERKSSVKHKPAGDVAMPANQSQPHALFRFPCKDISANVCCILELLDFKRFQTAAVTQIQGRSYVEARGGRTFNASSFFWPVRKSCVLKLPD